MKKKGFTCWFCVVLLVLVFACHPDKNKQIDLTKPKFTTSDASELFFKNIRQSYYEKSEIKASKLDVYRIKDSPQESMPLFPTIVINWRYDEAYLLLELNEQLRNLDTVKVVWEDSVANLSGTYLFAQSGNKASHYHFATKIYNSIQGGQQMYILEKKGQKLSFLQNRPEREAFRKTMFDYYRLVNLL